MFQNPISRAAVEGSGNVSMRRKRSATRKKTSPRPYGTARKMRISFESTNGSAKNSALRQIVEVITHTKGPIRSASQPTGAASTMTKARLATTI